MYMSKVDGTQLGSGLRTFQQKKLKKMTKKRIVAIFLGLLGINVAAMLGDY